LEYSTIDAFVIINWGDWVAFAGKAGISVRKRSRRIINPFILASSYKT